MGIDAPGVDFGEEVARPRRLRRKDAAALHTAQTLHIRPTQADRRKWSPFRGGRLRPRRDTVDTRHSLEVARLAPGEI